MTKNIDAKPNKIVAKLNCNKIISASDNKIVSKIRAFLIEIVPQAIGRFLVLATFLSKLRSKISLMMQPAERIKTEPRKNKIVK